MERSRRTGQFESAAAKRRYQEKKDSELDQLLGLNTPDPMAVFMESAGVKPKSSQRSDDVYCYDYPSTARLKEAFGPGACACAPAKDSMPPRNPHMMPCISWQRRGECDKFYNTGWCPFDHPSDQNEDLEALRKSAARIGQWLDVSCLCYHLNRVPMCSLEL